MVTEDELRFAKSKWYLQNYAFAATDTDVQPFLGIPVTHNWLKKARMASFLSTRKVSARMGHAATTYLKFEQAESSGRISLANLRRCAEAMECELVYAIRPKGRLPFSECIWLTLMNAVKDHRRLRRRAYTGNGHVLLYLIRQKMFNPQFRRAQGWSRNFQQCAKEVVEILKMNRDLERRF